MRRFLQRILTKPVSWLANRYSSKPDEKRVHTALTKLYEDCLVNPGKKGLVINTTAGEARFIIFSDQHKGARDGSDDFKGAEPNYMEALNYYLKENYHFISLGDEEELWENTVWPVKEKNKENIALQKLFLDKSRYTKVYGNHDIFWNNDPFAGMHLKDMYGSEVKIYEAVLLQIDVDGSKLPIFCTHGHQGDGQSDGNPFSAWFVARIWAPLQTFLSLNLNVPAANNQLKTAHNLFMYKWSGQDDNPVLITGHTHQPVFASLTHIELLYRQISDAKAKNDEDAITPLNKEIIFRQQDYDFVLGHYATMKPFYFNTGCCCYTDGDITGIEIADGKISLIKWRHGKNGAERELLEQMELTTLAG